MTMEFGYRDRDLEEQEFTVICDGCGEEYTDTLNSFQLFLADIKDSGWKIVKNGEDWEHFCSYCEPLDRFDDIFDEMR